ncbi:ribosomal protein L6e [Ancylostoma caninum]|uniref:Ribosomal protein L6e n=1 Tax=Ancylostoma caninum TaxID=29170 RepID=A0A368G6M2_ANCCA|nr:ribosomal protein L6e [Ancylostoma caninum]
MQAFRGASFIRVSSSGGPHKLNNFPLRRIAQAFVIATKTKVDVSGVKIPAHINDDYFKRKTLPGKKGENIFAAGKVEYQAFVIATKTKVDVSGVKIPAHINDDYFKRKTLPGKKGENIFAAGKVTDQRKTDQKAIDKPILAAIKKHPEHKFLFGYLGSRFMLAKRQYPHNMVF